MPDFRNDAFLFLLGGVVALFVTAQSLAFLVKAWKQGRRIGLTPRQMSKTVWSAAIFSVVPSLAILLGLLTLAGSLGLAWPWTKLNVVGSITYDLTVAETTAQGFGMSTKAPILDKTVFTAIVWAMSFGSVFGMILVAFFVKKIQKGIDKAKQKDTKWIQLMVAALFMGLISAFFGSAVGGGPVSLASLATAALVMVVFSWLIQARQQAWLESYALPVSMVAGMAMAVVVR